MEKQLHEACLMSTTVWEKLKEYLDEPQDDKPYIMPCCYRYFGIAVYTLADKYAVQVPELGLRNVVFGSRVAILTLRAKALYLAGGE